MQPFYFYRKGIVIHKSIKLAENIKTKDGRKEQLKREEIEKNLNKDRVDFDVVSEESQEEDNISDKDFISDEKKEKYGFKLFGKMTDDMPNEYKHPLHGLRSVRTELRTVMSKLSSELHMSKMSN